jgi:hypothetical protein
VDGAGVLTGLKDVVGDVQVADRTHKGLVSTSKPATTDAPGPIIADPRQTPRRSGE